LARGGPAGARHVDHDRRTPPPQPPTGFGDRAAHPERGRGEQPPEHPTVMLPQRRCRSPGRGDDSPDDLGQHERKREGPPAGAERGADRGVHEQAKRHRGQDRELGLASGYVEEGGLVDPYREHCAQQHQGLGGATPGKVVEQVLRQLRDGEDEDQVVEQLKRRNRAALGRLTGHSHAHLFPRARVHGRPAAAFIPVDYVGPPLTLDALPLRLGVTLSGFHSAKICLATWIADMAFGQPA
jgi:hypothetical protein